MWEQFVMHSFYSTQNSLLKRCFSTWVSSLQPLALLVLASASTKPPRRRPKPISKVPQPWLAPYDSPPKAFHSPLHPPPRSSAPPVKILHASGFPHPLRRFPHCSAGHQYSSRSGRGAS